MTLKNTTPKLNSDHLDCIVEGSRTFLVSFILRITLKDNPEGETLAREAGFGYGLGGACSSHAFAYPVGGPLYRLFA